MLSTSLFLLALACSTAARVPMLKPAIDTSFPVQTGFECTHDTYYPHPSDSHKFVQCTHGAALEMPCAPAILLWNQQTLQCDWGEDQQGVQIQGGQDLNTAPEALYADTVNCAGKHDTLHPNPQSAFTFIQCSNDVAHVMPCAPNNPGSLVWNNERQRCDYEMSDAAVVPLVAPQITPAAQQEQVVPSGVIDPTFTCDEKHDTHHTNPNDVFSFIQCVHGVAHIMPCAPDHPGTLVWNSATEQCDRPTGTETNVIVTKPAVLDTTSVKVNCFGRHDTLIPNPSSINSFIQCVHGIPWEMPCASDHPGSLVWNDAKKQCDFPSTSIAMLKPALSYGGDVVPVDAGFNCNGRHDTHHPYPISSNFFVQCVHGTSYVMPCPSDLVWNNALQRCNYS